MKIVCFSFQWLLWDKSSCLKNMKITMAPYVDSSGFVSHHTSFFLQVVQLVSASEGCYKVIQYCKYRQIQQCVNKHTNKNWLISPPSSSLCCIISCTATYPCATSAECVTVGLITGDWVLVAEMGATTVGSTAVEVVTGGRDWGQREMAWLVLYTVSMLVWMLFK